MVTVAIVVIDGSMRSTVGMTLDEVGCSLVERH